MTFLVVWLLLVLTVALGVDHGVRSHSARLATPVAVSVATLLYWLGTVIYLRWVR